MGESGPLDRSRDPWPVEIRLKVGGRVLSVAFEDGRTVALPAELLRCRSPSAEVQGHGPADRVLVPGRRDVAITAVEPVGRYAVRPVFSDGHSTGIFTWSYLAELGADPDGSLAAYRAELAAAGLSHGPER